MASSATDLDARTYFGGLSVAIVESGSLERDIIIQVLQGFKVRSIAKFVTTDDAVESLPRDVADVLVVGTAEGRMDAYGLIRWLRHSAADPLRTAGVILLTGHTQHANVIRARDCGANFVLAKPITPLVLYGRMSWLGRDPRPFVTSEAYTGPDRRFQALGPPAGMNGRRSTDLSLKVGEASAPNMSQDEIDAMLNFKPAPR